MKAELRPKIYLALCLIALTLEGLYIFLNRPLACVKCRNALVAPSRELPAELCQPCVEQVRAVIAPSGQTVIVYEPPYPVDPADPVVSIETSRGRIEVELFAARAPISVENFLRYARAGHYDGTIFHRLEDYLCVAGHNRGGYGEPLVLVPQFPPIPSEAGRGLENRMGTLSLPHADGDADTATSDFFFNLQDNPFYDRPRPNGYAVFGQVLRGFNVVHGFKRLATVKEPWDRFPAERLAVERVIEHGPGYVPGTISAIETRVGGGARVR
jgi:peptidyl-prolyl cis-trans isomerase A (cyclophilin A)